MIIIVNVLNNFIRVEKKGKRIKTYILCINNTTTHIIHLCIVCVKYLYLNASNY